MSVVPSCGVLSDDVPLSGSLLMERVVRLGMAAEKHRLSQIQISTL